MDHKKAWDELKSELDRQKTKAEKEYKIRKNVFHEARKTKESEEEQKELYGYMEQSKLLVYTLNYFSNFMEVLEKHIKEG